MFPFRGCVCVVSVCICVYLNRLLSFSLSRVCVLCWMVFHVVWFCCMVGEEIEQLYIECNIVYLLVYINLRDAFCVFVIVGLLFFCVSVAIALLEHCWHDDADAGVFFCVCLQ